MNDTEVSAPRPASRYRFAIGASLLLLNVSMGMSFLEELKLCVQALLDLAKSLSRQRS